MARTYDAAAGDETRGVRDNWAGQAPGQPSRHEDRARRVAPAAAGTLTVYVPMTFARRGGRKRMLAPDGKPVVLATPSGASPDTPVVRALARAFRWRKMIEASEYANVREIAVAEAVNASYVSRVLRLTLLAPGILERLIEGSVAQVDVTVEALLEPLPVRWEEQMRTL